MSPGATSTMGWPLSPEEMAERAVEGAEPRARECRMAGQLSPAPSKLS